MLGILNKFPLVLQGLVLMLEWVILNKNTPECWMMSKILDYYKSHDVCNWEESIRSNETYDNVLWVQWSDSFPKAQLNLPVFFIVFKSEIAESIFGVVQTHW